VIAAPLQGPGWFNAAGCCLASALHRRLLYPGNGRWVKGETFAIDWLQERNGSLFEGDGSRNNQWFGFGARRWWRCRRTDMNQTSSPALRGELLLPAGAAV